MVICTISSFIFHLSFIIGFSGHIAAILFLLSNILLSGGIHEDGLADLADGMFVGKNVKEKLIIMNDSRIGVFGVLAIIITFSLKFLAISQFTPEISTYLYLILISMVSRYHMLFFLRFLKPIKKDGLGRGYKVQNNITLVIGITPVIFFIYFLNLNGIIIFFSMLFSCLILLKIISITFKGQTGDICGASQQIIELVGLLTLTLIY